MGISTLMNIGNSALTASQASIQVTGNNIANVDTPGYSRQYVVQSEAKSLTMRPGQMGQGVKATEIMRRFSAFLEKSYVQQSSITSRWSEQHTVMQSVENIFNEANRSGISSQMNTLFKGWQDLSLRPEDAATRTSLISQADSLTLLMRNTITDLERIQREMNTSIDDQVKKVNELTASIAAINVQIEANSVKGMSNPNSLMDQRDSLVRQLAECVDIEIQDRGGGDYNVATAAGMPLVEGGHTYKLEVMGPQAEANLTARSTFGGKINFEGSDAHEYTVEIVKGGLPGNPNDIGYDPADNPTFRVSLDGGKTWLKDDDGQEIHYQITDSDQNGTTDPVLVKNLKISFDYRDQNGNYTPLTGRDSGPSGDRFGIVPKDGLYWIEPTKGPRNITPQIYLDGTDNPGRLTGGKLTAYYNVRDDNCGRYMDELNAVAQSLIWEVNRLHSQGAGTDLLTYSQGSYTAYDSDVPLGSPQSGLAFYDRLEAGNINFYIYDSNGDLSTQGPLDFGGLGVPPSPAGGNFDPAAHSLNDVAAAINQSYGGAINAEVVNNQLTLTSAAGTSFACGTDTTGVLAALGINTFFSGSNASDIAVNAEIRNNPSRIAAGHVNGQNEANPGDNSTATAIAKLTEVAVRVSTVWKTTNSLTLNNYYNNTVALVGADARQCKLNTEYNTALSQDLDERASAISGVNLDEEMSSLIKFQHSYTAAAKLITTADQMLQTILGLKQ